MNRISPAGNLTSRTFLPMRAICSGVKCRKRLARWSSSIMP